MKMSFKWVHRLALGALMALALTGCATGSLFGADTPPTAEARYAAARLDLNTSLISLTQYAVKPRCSAAVQISCSRQDVIDRGYDLASTADRTLDQARIILDAGGGLDAGQQLLLATSALGALQSILISELGE